MDRLVIQSRRDRKQGLLVLSLGANCAASVLGIVGHRWWGEPLWLDIVRTVLVLAAVVGLAVFAIRSVRRRAADDGRTEGVGE